MYAVNRNKIFGMLSFLLFIRLIAMIYIPLNDTTEARYGEIARIMLETGNWITPMQEYGVPFWAKPPLSSWLSSISMAICGINEFAARLPALILSVGVLWLVFYVAKLRKGLDFALISCLILSGSLYFYLDAGAVMTDPALLFSTSLILFSFWLAVYEKRKVWGYLFFVGLGLGMLAKGPVSWVLTGLPLFVWVFINNKWRDIWKYLPWLSGLFLCLAIFLPWYVLAEYKTPGFLNYFIVGENINRFLKPGWEGDMYGGAHLAPYGYIWLYAIIGVFPWIIPLVSILRKNFKQIFDLKNQKSEWFSFLLLCMFAPLVFFTFASNIIYPYVFPTLPFFAILLTELIVNFDSNKINSNYITWLAICSGLIFLFVTLIFVFKPNLIEKSQKRVVNLYNLHKKSDSNLAYWLPKTEYSARFYSHGKASAINNLSQLQAFFINKNNLLAINLKYIKNIPNDILKNMQEIDRVDVRNNSYILLKNNHQSS